MRSRTRAYRARIAIALAQLLILSGTIPVAFARAEGETDDVAIAGLSRGATLGPFLSEHWILPIPPQGPTPEGFTAAEASLAPEQCAGCHPKEFAEWRGSLHAAAFSPGFSGQLIEGVLAHPAGVRACQTCHAPLSEQLPFDVASKENADFDESLRRQGIVCAACHVRRHQRFGPPRRADLSAPPEPVSHGGFEARAEYQEASFCAPCHQFFDDPGPAGKPLENTWLEWRSSPQALEGRTCQACHMPDRSHTWLGIHDAEMVRAAIAQDLFLLDVTGDALHAALVLQNRDVGHAFPTYVAPRVTLEIHQRDQSGQPIAGTERIAIIGREVDLSSMQERFDTRVMPGEQVKLDYAVARAPGAQVLVGRVTVDPDHHYRGVFETLARTYRDEQVLATIREALRSIADSPYVLAEIERPLP